MLSNVVSLDTLADMQCRRVGDINEDMSPTRHDMSANEGLGRHDRLRHSLLSAKMMMAMHHHQNNKK